MSLKIHTIENAPEKSKAILEGVKAKFGFVPNLMGAFAASPEILQAYLTVSSLLDKTSLTETERQIALLAASSVNNCEYCMAAHSTVSKMQNLPADVIEAVSDFRACIKVSCTRSSASVWLLVSQTATRYRSALCGIASASKSSH